MIISDDLLQSIENRPSLSVKVPPTLPAYVTLAPDRGMFVEASTTFPLIFWEKLNNADAAHTANNNNRFIKND